MSDACGRGETSPEELAFEAELHRTYISGVERGVRNPTVTIVAKIAKALGLPRINCFAPVDSPKGSQRRERILRPARQGARLSRPPNSTRLRRRRARRPIHSGERPMGAAPWSRAAVLGKLPVGGAAVHNGGHPRLSRVRRPWRWRRPRLSC